MNEISHYNLCKLTAEWQLKKWHIVLYEYQASSVGSEYPDVLCYKNGYTELFEIKMSRQDFLKDKDKECRNEKIIKYYPQHLWRHSGKLKEILYESADWKPTIKEFVKEHPHLGRRRYYVCPKGLIKKEEISNGFGLYYFNDGKFRKVKDSKQFKCNIYIELHMLAHAFRKHASGNGDNVLVNTYEIKW